VSQILLKTSDGNGRVSAHEILLGSHAIRNLIREGKVAQMRSVMQTSASSGMQTLDQSLAGLLRQQRITLACAQEAAYAPAQLAQALSTSPIPAAGT